MVLIQYVLLVGIKLPTHTRFLWLLTPYSLVCTKFSEELIASISREEIGEKMGFLSVIFYQMSLCHYLENHDMNLRFV
jgi:hypothetical protein